MLNADPLAALDLMNAGAPILSPSAPILTAREMTRRHYMHGDHRTLHHLQGTFYAWCETHYAEFPSELIRAAIWIFLEDAAVKDNNGKLLAFCSKQAPRGERPGGPGRNMSVTAAYARPCLAGPPRASLRRRVAVVRKRTASSPNADVAASFACLLWGQYGRLRL